MGKLSALVWRTLDKSGNQDPRLIRHLYDLSSLHNYLSYSEIFAAQCKLVLESDLTERAKPPLKLPEALSMIIAELQTNPIHKKNYQDYLENFIYAPTSGNQLSFEVALYGFEKLINNLGE